MKSSVQQVTFLSADILNHKIFELPIQTGAFWRWNSNSAVNGKTTTMKVFSKQQTFPLAQPRRHQPAEQSCLDFQLRLPIQGTWQEPTSRQLTRAFKYWGFLESCFPPQDTAAGLLPQTEYFWQGSFLDSMRCCHTEGPRGLYKAFVVCFSLFTGTSQLFFPLISYKSEVPAAMVLLATTAISCGERIENCRSLQPSSAWGELCRMPLKSLPVVCPTLLLLSAW